MCVTREAERIAMTAESRIAREDHRSLLLPARVEVMIVVERPKGIEAGCFCLLSLLPIYPPKINALAFERMVKNLEIGLHKLGIGNVEGDKLLFLGIVASALAHFLISILKKSDTL